MISLKFDRNSLLGTGISEFCPFTIENVLRGRQLLYIVHHTVHSE